uniref:Uncharacterized protein n=1 Tax=Arundo donax TaxID=35708 RepID=A0A0A9G0J3_ARUDO
MLNWFLAPVKEFVVTPSGPTGHSFKLEIFKFMIVKQINSPVLIVFLRKKTVHQTFTGCFVFLQILLVNLLLPLPSLFCFCTVANQVATCNKRHLDHVFSFGKCNCIRGF